MFIQFRRFILFSLPFLFLCCKKPVPPIGVVQVNVTEAKTLINDKKDLIIIDARTPKEVADGKIENALNYNVKADEFIAQVSQLDTLKTYLVYCRSGMRSTKAVSIMTDLGFKNLYNMEGGFLAWEKSK